MGADIGGFAENSNAELFARWIQAGALTPFARNHNQTNQLGQYAFAWGEEVLDIAREAIKLRYRLMPYLYAAFVAASQTGEPIQRPLVFDYQHDSETHDLDDQYLFGSQLLVAPVFEQDARVRSVYLPAGEWIDWHSGALQVSKGEHIRSDAPLSRIPLYVKAGSVIPMWSEVPKSTADYYPAEIELRVFVPAADGSWTSQLQEDDGLTFGALDGKLLSTELTLTRSGSKLKLVGKTSGEGFAEFARSRYRITLIGAESVQGSEVVIENSGNDFELEFDLA